MLNQERMKGQIYCKYMVTLQNKINREGDKTCTYNKHSPELRMILNNPMGEGRLAAVSNEAFFEMEQFTPDVRNADGPSIIKGEKPEPHNVITDSVRPAKRPSPRKNFRHLNIWWKLLTCIRFRFG
jgi:hypothetical protein